MDANTGVVDGHDRAGGKLRFGSCDDGGNPLGETPSVDLDDTKVHDRRVGRPGAGDDCANVLVARDDDGIKLTRLRHDFHVWRPCIEHVGDTNGVITSLSQRVHDERGQVEVEQ